MWVFREAIPDDIEGIARLHVTSWQENYRGAFSDTFLDAEAIIERRLTWHERLNNPEPGQFVYVAEWKGAIVGFVCAYFDHSSKYGTLLDNLHVAAGIKGRGIGTGLMGLVAQAIKARELHTGLYLWVLAQNKEAHDFYRKRGGEKIETVEGHDIGDRSVMKTRFFWKFPEDLLLKVDRSSK